MNPLREVLAITEPALTSSPTAKSTNLGEVC